MFRKLFLIYFLMLTPWVHADSIIPKGNRLLGHGLQEGAVGFDEAFKQGKEAGLEFVELPVQWDELEPSPGAYTNQWVDIANTFYGNKHIKLFLSINPIDTNNLRLPHDLKHKPFDDPEVIERYRRLVDYVLSRLGNVEVIGISVGNEIDIYLGNNKTKWDQYTRFIQASSKYINIKKPNVPVGSKATMYGYLKEAREYLKKLNGYTDHIMVTYYPLSGDFHVKDPSVVSQEIRTLVNMYKNRPIMMPEVGYPSSQYLGSSEEKQGQFIEELFKTWDQYHKEIQLINFIWMHDVSKDHLNTMEQYYGLGDQGFSEYLGTLGLRTYQGKDKKAFQILKKQAKARGWNVKNINKKIMLQRSKVNLSKPNSR